MQVHFLTVFFWDTHNFVAFTRCSSVFRAVSKVFLKLNYQFLKQLLQKSNLPFAQVISSISLTDFQAVTFRVKS